MMDQKYLAEIKTREQAATPGPWEVKTNRHPETTGEAWGWIRGPFENWCWTDRRSRSRPDAEFVAHARTDIPALLADNAAKDQQIATLTKALEMANITIQKLSGENYEYSTSSFPAQKQEGKE